MFIEALARRQPLCLMFEDVHWAEDALLDLIEFIASRAKEVPLLIVAQARPNLLEKRPAWGRGVRAFTSLPIEPLGETDGRELILALCRERGLNDALAEQVGRGAGGNPLFAEELVAMIAERGTQAGIPSAIKAIISARLDALPPDARRALQLAAVLGKVFWDGGVRALGSDGDVTARLELLEQADLLRAQSRSQFRGEREFAFKHDLIRDVAYEMLPRAERKTLHLRAADWIEQAAGRQFEVHLDQLAHHALKAGEEERAVNYLVRAAERASRTAAYRHEAALLAEAIAIAERKQQRELVGELRARRGKALLNIAQWSAVIPELEAALDILPSTAFERRAEAHVGIAWSAVWVFDQARAMRHGAEGLSAARRAGRADLEADAIGTHALMEHSAGRFPAAREMYRTAIAKAGGVKVGGLCYAPSTLYQLGDYEEGIKLAEEGVASFRAQNNHTAALVAMSHLGLNLAAQGHYAEAARKFAEAEQFGREYELWSLLARSISMSSDWHADLFDFGGAEALAEEARDLAQSVNFPNAVISTGLDLLFNYTRRGEVGRVEALIEKVVPEAVSSSGWHSWMWKVRVAQVHAEIAFARGQHDETLRWAENALTESVPSGRVKYQGLAWWVKARALHALGRSQEAIEDLRKALEMARRIHHPAMFIRISTALLEIAGDDALLAEARATAKQILAELPAGHIRQRFSDAEPLRVLGRLTD